MCSMQAPSLEQWESTLASPIPSLGLPRMLKEFINVVSRLGSLSAGGISMVLCRQTSIERKILHVSSPATELYWVMKPCSCSVVAWCNISSSGGRMRSGGVARETTGLKASRRLKLRNWETSGQTSSTLCEMSLLESAAVKMDILKMFSMLPPLRDIPLRSLSAQACNLVLILFPTLE